MNRHMNLGKLADHKTKRYRLMVRIDGIVKSILVHFEPLDADMQYVNDLDPRRLAVHVSDMERLHKDLKVVNAEIKRLEDELGESSDQ
jgi:hypothetical protein